MKFGLFCDRHARLPPRHITCHGPSPDAPRGRGHYHRLPRNSRQLPSLPKHPRPCPAYCVIPMPPTARAVTGLSSCRMRSLLATAPPPRSPRPPPRLPPASLLTLSPSAPSRGKGSMFSPGECTGFVRSADAECWQRGKRGSCDHLRGHLTSRPPVSSHCCRSLSSLSSPRPRPWQGTGSPSRRRSHRQAPPASRHAAPIPIRSWMCP